MPRPVAATVILVVIALAGAAMLRSGVYGWTLFALVPFAIGAVGAWVGRVITTKGALGAGALAAGLATCSLLLIGLEGAICIAMALPLTLPLGALGGYFWLRMSRRERAGSTALLLILPIGTFGYDVTAQPPVFQVRTSIEIAAPPEKVWPHVVAFREIAGPDEWYFRTGLAYPKRTRIEGSGPGAARYCELSTGPVEEQVEVWDEPRLLRFQVTRSPAPMSEWSPYGAIQPRHLHGYFESRRGEFLLIPLPNGRTRVEGTSWYQHGLWPAQYWRLWTDAIIHRIHWRVLEHIKALATTK